VTGALGFVIERLDDGASKAVHDGQALRQEQEKDSSYKYEAKHDFILEIL
jgi:hypothetical protein